MQDQILKTMLKSKQILPKYENSYGFMMFCMGKSWSYSYFNCLDIYVGDKWKN